MGRKNEEFPAKNDASMIISRPRKKCKQVGSVVCRMGLKIFVLFVSRDGGIVSSLSWDLRYRYEYSMASPKFVVLFSSIRVAICFLYKNMLKFITHNQPVAPQAGAERVSVILDRTSKPKLSVQERAMGSSRVQVYIYISQRTAAGSHFATQIRVSATKSKLGGPSGALRNIPFGRAYDYYMIACFSQTTQTSTARVEIKQLCQVQHYLHRTHRQHL